MSGTTKDLSVPLNVNVNLTGEGGGSAGGAGGGPQVGEVLSRLALAIEQMVKAQQEMTQQLRSSGGAGGGGAGTVTPPAAVVGQTPTVVTPGATGAGAGAGAGGSGGSGGTGAGSQPKVTGDVPNATTTNTGAATGGGDGGGSGTGGGTANTSGAAPGSGGTLYDIFDRAGTRSSQKWGQVSAGLRRGFGGGAFYERLNSTPVPGDKEGRSYAAKYLNSEGVAVTGFDMDDPVMGRQHIRGGTNMPQFGADKRASLAQMMGQRTYMGLSAVASPITHPSQAPEGGLMQLAGSAAMTSSNPYVATGGAVASVAGSVIGLTSGALLGEGHRVAQLERPYEQLQHMGSGTSFQNSGFHLSKLSTDTGYSDYEVAYKVTEDVKNMGRRMSTQEYSGLRTNALYDELQGYSPGVGSFFKSAGRSGGAALSGNIAGGTDIAYDEARRTSSGMGLAGSGSDAYISRIAHLLQGIAEHGMKIDERVPNKQALRLHAIGQLGARGGETPYMQQDRAAALTSNAHSFLNASSQKFDMKEQMQNLAQGAHMAAAAGNLKGRGETLTWDSILEEKERIANAEDGPEQLRRAVGSSKEAQKQVTKHIYGMSALESKAYEAGSGDEAAVRARMAGTVSDRNKTVVASEQDFNRTFAANIQALRLTVESHSTAVKNLDTTLANWKAREMEVGAVAPSAMDAWLPTATKAGDPPTLLGSAWLGL